MLAMKLCQGGDDARGNTSLGGHQVSPKALKSFVVLNLLDAKSKFHSRLLQGGHTPLQGEVTT